MLNLFIIITEAITMLIWLHILFKSLLKESRGKIIFIVLYTAYFYITTEVNTPFIIDIIPILLMFIWSKNQFEKNLLGTVIRFIFSLLALSILQLVMLESVYLIDLKLFKIGLVGIYLFASIATVIITLGIYLIINRKNLKIKEKNRAIICLWVYIILILLVMIFIKYDYEKYNGAYSFLYILLYLLLAFFIMGIVSELNVKYKLEQKQMELELKERYDEVYKTLITEMRSKQHDYKNQLSALYGSQYLQDYKNEANETRKQYIDALIENDKFDNILLTCENPILAGYLYTQCSRAERLGIMVETKVVCSSKDYQVPLHIIIEMLGIMINNAIEYLADKDKKRMKLEIIEKESNIQIVVENIAEYITYKEQENMFNMGYSTKGTGRGIGLYSLKKIVNKYKGELLVENITREDENWFKIGMII